MKLYGDCDYHRNSARVTTSMLVIRRHGPLKGELEGDTRIQLLMGEPFGRFWSKLILYVLLVFRHFGNLNLYL